MGLDEMTVTYEAPELDPDPDRKLAAMYAIAHLSKRTRTPEGERGTQAIIHCMTDDILVAMVPQLEFLLEMVTNELARRPK